MTSETVKQNNSQLQCKQPSITCCRVLKVIQQTAVTNFAVNNRSTISLAQL